MEFFRLGDGFLAGALTVLAVSGAIQLWVGAVRSHPGMKVTQALRRRLSAWYADTPKSLFAAGQILSWACLAFVLWAYLAQREQLLEIARVCQAQKSACDRQHYRHQHHPAVAPLRGASPEALNDVNASLFPCKIVDERLARGGQARALIDRPYIGAGSVLGLHVAEAEPNGGNPYRAHGCADQSPPARSTWGLGGQPSDRNRHQHVENSWNVHSPSPALPPAQHSAKAGA